jgi:CRISPR system Cascade subunit CasE
MIFTKATLARRPGTQGSIAKVLLSGALVDSNHGLVWSLFSRADDSKRDFQFRAIEPGSFLIVSERPPDDPHGLWHIAQPKPYEPLLAVGDRLSFVLRANPTMAVFERGSKRGKRVDVIMHAKHQLGSEARAAFTNADACGVALDWLHKRGPAIGAEFETDACEASGYVQVAIPRGQPIPEPSRRSKSWSKDAITFSQIDYAGLLTVMDPAKLQAALFHGIGKSKAYGCGLMLIRRV